MSAFINSGGCDKKSPNPSNGESKDGAASEHTTKSGILKRKSSGHDSGRHKRRISFNPIANRRQPSNDDGNYEVTDEPLQLPKEVLAEEQKEQSRKEEDINYVFLYVLNDWHANRSESDVERNMEIYADKRAGKEAANGREIYRATHEDLLARCQQLVTQLQEGKRVTLKGKAGRMIVEPEAGDSCNIEDVTTLIQYLTVMTVSLEF